MTEGKRLAFGAKKVELLYRMAKRETKNSLRILPLHLAMEGFLSMFFSGPSIEELVRRMEKLDFGYLINNQLREKCRQK